MRVKGHKLVSLEWNGERGRMESSWTARCACGWEESCHSAKETRFEYRIHLSEKTKELAEAEKLRKELPQVWNDHLRFDT